MNIKNNEKYFIHYIQLTYRIKDSTPIIISLLMSSFSIIVGFMGKYAKIKEDIGLRTLQWYFHVWWYS